MTPFDPARVLADAIARGYACGDAPFRIDRRGGWHYGGTPISRPELVRLFADVLRRGPDGGHWLVTPVEQVRIEVEDAPFVAVELQASGEGPGQRLGFRTNLGEWAEAGPDRPLRPRPIPGAPPGAAPAPYLEVRPGLEARLLPAVYYELAALAVPKPGAPETLGVWGGGAFFELGPAADDGDG